MLSRNFEFLRNQHPELASLGGFAENYAVSDPASAAIKLRAFAECMVSAVFTFQEMARPYRAKKSFFIPVADIRGNRYDLSINRYKEIAYEEVQYEAPKKILARLESLEGEILADIKQLRGMLK